MSARRLQNASRPARHLAVVFALGAAGALALSACAPKKSATMEPISVTESKTEDQASAASANMDELTGLVTDLSTKAQNLPGRTAETHRAAMHDVFDNLTKLLPILAGPDAGGGFRQQLRSVEAARDRIAPDAGDVNADPAIGTGVRAAAAAFGDIAQDDDTFAGPEIGDNLKKLQSTVAELDTVGGVGRPYVTADSVQLMGQIAHQMADRITGGVSGTIASAPDAAPPAAAAPTAEPVAAPTDAAPVTTEPAAAPIEPKPAEQKADGGPTPPAAAEPASPAEPAPAPTAEPNK